MKTSSALLSIAIAAVLVTSMIFMGASTTMSAGDYSMAESDWALRWALGLDICRSGLLLQLPYGATLPSQSVGSGWEPDPNNILLWLDLDQATPGNQQTVFVPEGATITVTGEIQTWELSGTIAQDLIIYSWTPSWPPPEGYYYCLYDGIPGTYPGVTFSFSFELTVPNEPGVHYLYYGSGAHYSCHDAVQAYKIPLWVPYAVITASSSP